MGELVKKGDIIRLEKGMMIKTSVPEKIYYYDRPFSTEKVEAVIEIGKIYWSAGSTKDYLMNKIQNFLDDLGIEATEEQIEPFVDSLNIKYQVEELDTSIYEGAYIVSEAKFENSRTSPYKVKCLKTTDPNIKAEFYQNVTFYYKNSIPDVEIIVPYEE